MTEGQNSDLALAAWHVAQGRIIVARQRERITRLKALGCATFDYEHTLNVFVSTLEIFIEHERELRSRGVRDEQSGRAST